MPIYLLLPLAAAIIYALGSIIIKRALKEGVTMDQSFHLTNLVLGVLFLPFFFFGRGAFDWSQAGKPLMIGAAFFFGHWLTFIAIRRGDVSFVTPLMGTKVVFVAIGVVLLTGHIPSVPLLIAAVLTTIGIFVMGLADLKGGSHLAYTVLVTLASALVFGLFDVLVSWWAPEFGGLTLVALGMGLVPVFTMILWLFQGRPALMPDRKAAKWAWWGAGMIALQAITMGIGLTFFNDATGVNVVYASRGLWVIVLLVVFGRILGNSERHETGRGFLWRIGGTLILTIAIIIAVADRAAAIGN